MEIYHYRKNTPASEPIDYKLLKKRASLINSLRKIAADDVRSLGGAT